jgi:hypothetical protein
MQCYTLPKEGRYATNSGYAKGIDAEQKSLQSVTPGYCQKFLEKFI